MLKLFSCLLITVTFPISMGYTLRTVQEYERGVIFRMGRLKKKSTIGPGMYFIIPCIDKVKVQFNTIFFSNALSRLQIPLQTFFYLITTKISLELRMCIPIWKEDYWQNPENFFSGDVIFGGQNPKKFSKIFIVPNRLSCHTDHLYTYKGHIEHVGFT